MSRDLQLYLTDILVACEKVLRYTDGMNFEQFVADDRTFDAVIRNLQIIGEAVKNIPIQVRDLSPEIEWRKIAGLRDMIALFSRQDRPCYSYINHDRFILFSKHFQECLQ